MRQAVGDDLKTLPLVCSVEETMERAELRLVRMCEEWARMLQEQFGVTVNHVNAHSILISIFHFEKNPSDRTSRQRREERRHQRVRHRTKERSKKSESIGMGKK
jgi:poly(A) polymerase Pap1